MICTKNKSVLGLLQFIHLNSSPMDFQISYSEPCKCTVQVGPVGTSILCSEIFNGNEVV